MKDQENEVPSLSGNCAYELKFILILKVLQFKTVIFETQNLNRDKITKYSNSYKHC